MKFRRIIVSSLAAVCAAASISAFSATAYADSPETVYPTNFEKTLDLTAGGIKDFAISGDGYAFCSSTKVYLIYTDDSGDRKLQTVDYGSGVDALDYSDGNLYCKKSGGVYVFPDTATSVDYDGFSTSMPVTVNSDAYILTATGQLAYYKNNYESSETLDGSYTILKKFDDIVYAVKDNVPYRLNGSVASALDLSYKDFSIFDNAVYIGGTADALKDESYTVKVAKLASDSYCTEIEDDLSGTYFQQINTIKTDSENSVLVLAESGNSSVIVLDNALYITLKANLSTDDYSATSDDICKNGTAYVLQTAGLYSSPYICAATKICDIESTYVNADGVTKRTAVTVLEKFSLSFIDEEFYKVSYTATDGTTKTGYVAAGFLSAEAYEAENGETTTVRDTEFNYDTNVTAVILVLAIVGLVILAIVYLTLVGTKKPAKSKKRREREESDGDDYSSSSTADSDEQTL